MRAPCRLRTASTPDPGVRCASDAAVRRSELFRGLGSLPGRSLRRYSRRETPYADSVGELEESGVAVVAISMRCPGTMPKNSPTAVRAPGAAARLDISTAAAIAKPRARAPDPPRLLPSRWRRSRRMSSPTSCSRDAGNQVLIESEAEEPAFFRPVGKRYW